MKKLTALILAACIVAGGCGGKAEKENGNDSAADAETEAKEISDTYESGKLKEISIKDIVIQIPESWEKDKSLGIDGSYKYDELSVFVRDERYEQGTDYLIKNIKQVIKDTEVEGTEINIISINEEEVSGVKAVDVCIDGRLNDYKFIEYELLFVYNEKLYRIGFISESDSKIDYSKDYESFKEHITFKEEIDEKETDESEEQENKEIILNEEYKFNGGYVIMSLSKDENEKYNYSISVNSDTEWKAALAYTFYSAMINAEGMERMNPSLIMACNDVMISKTMSWKTNENGETEIIDGVQWVAEQLSNAEYTEDEYESMSNEFKSFAEDFMLK